MRRLVAASDVGGTFTDLVVWDGRRLHTMKRVTQPRDRTGVVLRGTMDLVRGAGASAQDLAWVVHGTTAGTNAVLQRKGGRVALLTNAGFEDLIEIGRQNRPRLYDLSAVRPEPLVPRGLRFGVRGRLDKRGQEIEPLHRSDLRRAARAARRARVDAVAVCFLHSYASGRHEAQAARAVRAAGIGRTSMSHDVSPELREYERFTTTIVNAFLQPVFHENLQRFERGLSAAGSPAPLFVVASNGGMVSAPAAQRMPVQTVLSGPAGGVAAGGELARRLGIRAALTFDMGGTSTDLAVLQGGRAALRPDADVAGFPIRTPSIDLVTIGAGGGSIARLDPGRILRVGPESAEAWPGPACYGRGGRHATVTDADVLLGRIRPEGFLAGRGEVRLEPALAERSLARLGRSFDLGARATARALLDVATANLQGGIRNVTTQRGLDPSDFWLVAFGGAGPMHGLEAAPGIGIRNVIVPAEPAVFSAWGMLVGDVRHSLSAGRLLPTDGPAVREAFKLLTELKATAAGRMHDEGFGAHEVRVAQSCDLRYVGQSYELTVPLARPDLASMRRAVAAFRRLHKRRFGHADPRRPVELVTVRLDASAVPRPRPRPPRVPKGTSAIPAAARNGERDAFFLRQGRRRAVVIERRALRSGNRLVGPAIMEGGDHTFLLPPGSRAKVGPWGDLEVRL